MLTRDEVEPDRDKQRLFEFQGEFATPLWYYLLIEGERKASGNTLRPLGSRLVSEVLTGGVYYNREFGQEAYVHDPTWRAVVKAGKAREVSFADIYEFVNVHA
jgi:hypothetical protein